MSKYNRVIIKPTEKDILKAEQQTAIYNASSQMGSDGPLNKYNRLLSLRRLLNVFPPEEYKVCGHPAGAIINDKWIVTLLSGKWRVVGKNKWYRLKDFEDFKDRFVNKSKEHQA